MALDMLASQMDFIILLTISVIIAIVVKKYIKLPYTIALVLFGIVIGFFKLTHIELTKEMIFFFFLPPLLFEGAIHFDLNHLKENFKLIGSLAFFGIIISTFVTGFLMHWLTGIELVYALLFGAIISPTDPISVLALFKKFGVNKQLSTIVEGESIFNDGTGIVLFTIILGLIETGHFSALEAAKEFIVVSAGGLVVGIILGYFAFQFCKSIEDNTIEVLITLVLAYASFIVAEHTFHVSGVMAVVAAGMLMGNTGRRLAMGPSVRIAIFSFWEIMAFIINSLIFILIGLRIPVTQVAAYGYQIIIAILVILAARALSVYGISWLLKAFRYPLDARWIHVMNWGGIRGSIPIALILGLPAIAYREQLSVIVYGCVLFSLVVQGMTMQPLITKLKIVKRTKEEKDYEYLFAKRVALNQMEDEARKLKREGRISDEKYKDIDKKIVADLSEVNKKINKLDVRKDIYHHRVSEVWHELLLLKKNIYMELANEGFVSEENLARLISEVDKKLDEEH
ncbi:MAG: Na+/H+ antiporter [Nanoarchaeota archaeon]|nr:Na+/H+ antiporter [Nanoarchaeota archaeon]